MDKKIILLTGIHGVGKGYLAEQIKDKVKIPIYEASDLIKKIANDVETHKKVKDIKKNQNILYESIKTVVLDDFFILDGHTCLLNKDGKIEKIDLISLKKLNIIGVICLYDDAKQIKKRLIKRDSYIYSEKLLTEFQQAELSNAKQLALEQKIPFMKYKANSNIELIMDFIRGIMEDI